MGLVKRAIAGWGLIRWDAATCKLPSAMATGELLILDEPLNGLDPPARNG